jgi:hypothetical protein
MKIRFANSDYALAMAIRNHKPTDDFTFKLQFEIDDVDEAATYDITCAYVANLENRFEKLFPDQLESIKKMRWGVPALHVQGHQYSCTYLFGTAYMECVGHFHGETVEHYWPEANRLGPNVRQMNLRHRQDTIINHHGNWNHKKTMKIREFGCIQLVTIIDPRNSIGLCRGSPNSEEEILGKTKSLYRPQHLLQGSGC